MKGLMFYEMRVNFRPWYCNICGRKYLKYESAWVYKEGDNLLLFCGDTYDCRDEFLELNKLKDVGEEDE